VFPRHRDHLPPFDPRAPSISYGYLHGYRHLAAQGHEPAFPFGAGLSYTRFQYSDLGVSPDQVRPDSVLSVSVDVSNVGTRDGDEVVQLYVTALDSMVSPRAPLDLRGFRRVRIAAGETRRVTIDLAVSDLGIWRPNGGWWIEPTGYRVAVGPSSDQKEHLVTTVRVVGPG